jgi:hypothetical protein
MVLKLCLDISEHEKSGITVFPNPSPGRYQLQCEVPTDVVIQDLAGRVVYRLTLPTGENIIDLSLYPAGIYNAQFSNYYGVSHGKWVKRLSE